MGDRDFSDSIKLEVIKTNLEKYNGNICCEACGKVIRSISECHFDHIFPYSKGGRSVASNCQILCIECNLKKNDKLLKDFLLEEKAKQFLNGSIMESENVDNSDSIKKQAVEAEQKTEISQRMSKEQFDEIIGSFIEKHGNITKVDFSREYNELPSVWYVKEYYGNLTELRKAFGIGNQNIDWNRETIKAALEKYIAEHGDFTQKDMKKENHIPTTMCILRYYPECKTITEFKKMILGMNVPIQWDKETAIKQGRLFLKNHDKLTQKDLKAENGLPTNNVILRLFGSLPNYQAIIGAEVYSKNHRITKEDIKNKISELLAEDERVFSSRKECLDELGISESIISKRYGGFQEFCKEENIIVTNSKKAKYTKREVDDAISNWVKEGNPVPKVHDFKKVGLPSMSVILKYYKDWREPFDFYKRLHEEAQRV